MSGLEPSCVPMRPARAACSAAEHQTRLGGGAAQEGADHRELRKAYFQKSKEW